MVLVIKRIGLGATQSSDFVDHSYEYWLNWTPLSPITIMGLWYINIDLMLLLKI